jgi:hypothetical protein
MQGLRSAEGGRAAIDAPGRRLYLGTAPLFPAMERKKTPIIPPFVKFREELFLWTRLSVFTEKNGDIAEYSDQA